MARHQRINRHRRLRVQQPAHYLLESSKLQIIASMTSLAELSLESCSLTHADQLGQLTQLKPFTLRHIDHIRGFAFLRRLSRLEFLRVYGLRRGVLMIRRAKHPGLFDDTRPVPPTITSLQLTFDTLECSDRSMLPWMVSQLDHLEDLSLTFKYQEDFRWAFLTLTDVLPTACLPRLKTFNLQVVQFVDDLSDFASCQALEYLNIELYGWDVIAGFGGALRGLPRLRDLTCYNLVLSEFIDTLPALERLTSRPDRHTGTRDAALHQAVRLATRCQACRFGVRDLYRPCDPLASSWFRFIVTECTRLESSSPSWRSLLSNVLCELYDTEYMYGR